jgi:beta-galactosidase
MQRRDFLKHTTLLGAAAALAPARMHAVLAAPTDRAAGRQVIPFCQHWLYSATLPEDPASPTLDDSAFAPVTLPHSTTYVPAFGADQDAYQFVSLYRKHFTLSALPPGARVFVDFEGAMLASTVFLNGTRLGEYFGGFTPFSFELTAHLRAGEPNVLAVLLDSHELTDVPPFGYQVDYLTFGGIYREVSLRIVPPTFLDRAHVRTLGVLTASPSIEVDLTLDRAADDPQPPTHVALTLLDDAGRTVAQHTSPLAATVTLPNLPKVKLWDLHTPTLYELRIELLRHREAIDSLTVTTGFREAKFTPSGFQLNGRVLKLRGLNRHQTFPYAGAAMPARVQRRDAEILKRELKANIVRCSHYPPSPHFLDACDELGLLVLDETPGWQHVGESATWRERYLDNTRRMIERDRNHPSVILWSVRINESQDFHDLYAKVNALAHSLDSTRQTTGVRYFQESELLEDVFSMNDFGMPLKAPNHPLYLNTEFVGGEYPVRSFDNNDIHHEHIRRYAAIYNQLYSDPRYAGGLGWCAFDYATHRDFGSGNHICYHGVMDIYRQPKLAAGFFRSQCSRDEEVVLQPGFHYAESDQPGGLDHAMVCSNCDAIRASIRQPDGSWKLVNTFTPDRATYPHLPSPPFFLHFPDGNDDWGDLRLEGLVAGSVKITRTLSARGIDQDFHLAADDLALTADGADCTRVTVTVTDEYGNVRLLANDPILIELTGPATLLGRSPLALSGGTAAVWVRTRDTAGAITVTATHPTFGARTLALHSTPATHLGL